MLILFTENYWGWGLGIGDWGLGIGELGLGGVPGCHFAMDGCRRCHV